jgi:hypothetical protein
MAATVAGLGVIGWLCADRSDDVLAALAAVPLWGFGAGVALHVVNAGVFLYALAVGAVTLTDRHIGAVRSRARDRSDCTEPRFTAVQLERAEA